MSLKLIAPPSADPVTLTEIKDHLRITDSEQDSLIVAALNAAVRTIEARAGIAMMSQTWRLVLDDIPFEPIKLTPSPVASIIEVRVAGDVVSPDAYELKAGSPGIFMASPPWPAPSAHLGGVEIDFTTGFGAAIDVPSPLKQAVKLFMRALF